MITGFARLCQTLPTTYHLDDQRQMAISAPIFCDGHTAFNPLRAQWLPFVGRWWLARNVRGKPLTRRRWKRRGLQSMVNS